MDLYRIKLLLHLPSKTRKADVQTTSRVEIRHITSSRICCHCRTYYCPNKRAVCGNTSVHVTHEWEWCVTQHLCPALVQRLCAGNPSTCVSAFEAPTPALKRGIPFQKPSSLAVLLHRHRDGKSYSHFRPKEN